MISLEERDVIAGYEVDSVSCWELRLDSATCEEGAAGFTVRGENNGIGFLVSRVVGVVVLQRERHQRWPETVLRSTDDQFLAPGAGGDVPKSVFRDRVGFDAKVVRLGERAQPARAVESVRAQVVLSERGEDVGVVWASQRVSEGITRSGESGLTIGAVRERSLDDPHHFECARAVLASDTARGALRSGRGDTQRAGRARKRRREKSTSAFSPLRGVIFHSSSLCTSRYRCSWSQRFTAARLEQISSLSILATVSIESLRRNIVSERTPVEHLVCIHDWQILSTSDLQIRSRKRKDPFPAELDFTHGLSFFRSSLHDFWIEIDEQRGARVTSDGVVPPAQ